MNDVQIGVIGQKYEDRKSGKSGELMSRDEEKKVLNFQNSKGSFTVSFASFRSNWRKIKDAEPVVNAEPDPIQPEPAEVDEAPKVPEMSEVEKIADFRAALEKSRKVTVAITLNHLSLTIDGIEALVAELDDEKSIIEMLPDLYYYSDFRSKLCGSKVHYDLSNARSVKAVTTLVSVGDILQVVKEAALEINLYGYTVEE